LNIIFWNINKKNLITELSELAHNQAIDIIILCEYQEKDFDTVKTLNKYTSIYKLSNCYGCTKIKIFTKLELSNISIVSESIRWTIRKITHPFYSTFLLVAVHLPSKNNWKDQDQAIEAIVFRDAIEQAKTDSKINRVVIIGDLNMNPFEDGLIGTKALHATPDKKIALKEKRRVQNINYEYFYNPMWNFLGDESIGQSPGTFYYRSSAHLSLDWHIFDQILISPLMIKDVPNKNIEIITSSKSFSLLDSKGKIDSKNYSDHLPLKFNISSNNLIN